MEKFKDAQRETVYHKYIFTDEELQQLGYELATSNDQKTEKEDEKKAVMASYKASIDALSSKINELSRKRVNGFESRQVLAYKVKDRVNHKWDFVHPDTGETIKTEDWTARDWQLDLDDSINANKQEKEAKNPDPFNSDDLPFDGGFHLSDDDKKAEGNLTFGNTTESIPQPDKKNKQNKGNTKPKTNQERVGGKFGGKAKENVTADLAQKEAYRFEGAIVDDEDVDHSGRFDD